MGQPAMLFRIAGWPSPRVGGWLSTVHAEQPGAAAQRGEDCEHGPIDSRGRLPPFCIRLAGSGEFGLSERGDGLPSPCDGQRQDEPKAKPKAQKSWRGATVSVARRSCDGGDVEPGQDGAT